MGDVQPEGRLAGGGGRGGEEGLAVVCEDLRGRRLLPSAQGTTGGPGRQGAARRGAGRSIDLVRHGTREAMSRPRRTREAPGENAAQVRRVPVHERGPKRTYRPDMTPQALGGEHPPGIASPQLRYARLGFFDAPDLEAWTRLAEELMPEVTVTIGLGPGCFARNAPVALKPLPPFGGDELRETPRHRVRAALQRRAGRRAPALRHAGLDPCRGAHAHRGARLPRRHDEPAPPARPRPARLDLEERPHRDARRHLSRGPRHRRQALLASTRPRRRSSAATSAPARPSAATALFEKPDLDALPEHAHIRQASPRTSGVTILGAATTPRPGSCSSPS